MSVENQAMTDTVNENAMSQSALEMSDEEIANLDFSAFEQVDETAEPTAEAVEDDEATEDQTSEDISDDEVETTAEVEVDESEEETEETTEEPDAEEDSEEEEPTSEESDESETQAIDYESEYKKLLEPFTANGKQISVENVEEARQLMSMGAGFNKKMAALKPNLKLMKSLENNGLLDEAKINYLIDLDKKNPDAIKKLVKESGIESYDFDAETDGDYKPNDYSVADGELQLDDVLTELSGSQYLSNVIDLVTKTWDGKSKQLVADNPQVLHVINSHMANGVYDIVSTEVERERMLGRLIGMSDLEAYKQVGDKLNAAGAFNSLAQSQSQPERKVIKTKAKAENTKLKSKKRAASSVKSSKTVTKQAPKNSLALSDEEFEREIMTKFL